MRYTPHGFVLPVADYAACVAFYRDVLDLPVLFALDRADSVLTGFDLAGAYLLVEPGGIAKTPETFPDEAQVRLRFNVAGLERASPSSETTGSCPCRWTC